MKVKRHTTFSLVLASLAIVSTVWASPAGAQLGDPLSHLNTVSGTKGFALREIKSSGDTVWTSNDNVVFEPASSIKI